MIRSVLDDRFSLDACGREVKLEKKNIRFQTKTDKCGRDFSSSALSIQPKILEISFGTPNRTDHFGLVRSDYSGPALMHVDHCDRSSHFGPSVGPKCSFPSDKIVVHSASLFILLTRTVTKRAVAWSGLCNGRINVPFHWARGNSEISNRNFC